MVNLAKVADASLDTAKTIYSTIQQSKPIANSMYLISEAANVVSGKQVSDLILKNSLVEATLNKTSHYLAKPISYVTKDLFSKIIFKTIDTQVKKGVSKAKKATGIEETITKSTGKIFSFIGDYLTPNDSETIDNLRNIGEGLGTYLTGYSEEKINRLFSEQINLAVQPLFSEQIDRAIENQITEFNKTQIRTFITSGMLSAIYYGLSLNNFMNSSDDFKNNIEFCQNLNSTTNLLLIYSLIFSAKVIPTVFKFFSENSLKAKLKEDLTIFIKENVSTSISGYESFDSVLEYAVNKTIDSNDKLTNQYLSLALNSYNTLEPAAREYYKRISTQSPNTVNYNDADDNTSSGPDSGQINVDINRRTLPVTNDYSLYLQILGGALLASGAVTVGLAFLANPIILGMAIIGCIGILSGAALVLFPDDIQHCLPDIEKFVFNTP